MRYPACMWLLVCIAVSAGVLGSPQAVRGDIVYAWGYNEYGQLGDGTTTNRPSPVAVSGLTGSVTDAAAGEYHALALQGGAAYAWGSNANGQIGDGTQTDHRYLPVAVSGLGSGVTAVATGAYDSLALQGGAVFAWGANTHGELGNATTTQSRSPVAVRILTSGVTAISSGEYHSLAIRDGAVFAWGWNNVGQLGDGTMASMRTSPVAVSGMDHGVTAIACGYYHNLAIQEGAVYAWGTNSKGELGDNTTTASRVPVAVREMDHDVTAIACSYYHSLAVQGGLVYAWGENSKGQLGDGTKVDHHTAMVVSGLSNIVEVAASWYSSYALSATGELWAWGFNGEGQLGVGDTTDRLRPTRVLAPDGYKFASIDCDSMGRHVVATVVPTPEPATLALLALGAAGLLRPRRRR